MKRLFAILLCVIFALLTACGTPSGDERGTTTHEESVTCAETKTADVTEPNTVRLNGDYDSVPTVIQPKPLSEKELKSISIPTSPNDPYSYVISDLLEWYKQAGSRFNSENERYSLYDINDDGTDELILARIGVLGGSTVYDYEGINAERTYGILIYSVYTISDGKAIKADLLAISGDAYQTILFDNGLIKVVCCTPRNPWIYYNKMVGDNFEAIDYPIFKNYNGECFSFKDCVENPITEEEFNRRIAETEKGAHPVEIEWKHLQDYGK